MLRRASFLREQTNRVGRRWFSVEREPASTTTTADDNKLYIGTHLWRLTCAFGFVYVFTEYGLELTICEGPSMLPTIQQRGEIVVMDRFTPRWYGIQGGVNGEERRRINERRQKAHETELRKNGWTGTPTWHQVMIPVNRIHEQQPDLARKRFWERLRSPVSVGDVVVIQHPDRVGTVCKRVLGLPGDTVTKPSRRNNEFTAKRSRRYRQGLPGSLVIPDGCIWLEGDNPWNSSDSRNYGPVPASLIVGRVLFRVWPLRGNAMLERGMRPERDPSEEPELIFSGSVVIPAGYDHQIIVHGDEDTPEEQ